MELRVRILALRCADKLWEYVLYSLQDYLTGVWGLSFTNAATHLNIWGGIRRILPIFSLFLADTLLGNFTVLLISGVAYSAGMVFVTVSSILSALGILSSTCTELNNYCINHTQKNVFLIGMALLGLGLAGQDACLDSFIEEQQEAPYYWWKKYKWVKLVVPLLIFSVPAAIGFFLFPYIREWFLLFGVSTVCMASAALVFLSGSKTYCMEEPQGSLLTVVCRVFVAVAYKIFQPSPPHSHQLFNEESHQYFEQDIKPFRPSRFLRFMEKAAIVLPDTSVEDQKKNRWKLCSVAEVECAKVVLRMVPIWSTFIICATVSSIGDTYFIEQAIHMERNIGKWKVPLQVFLLIYTLGKKLSDWLAKCMLKSSDVYSGPKGIGLASILSILCCISAALVEKMRLNVVRNKHLDENPDDDPFPMSAYWLLIQIFLLSGLDSFFQRGATMYVEHQAPVSMWKYLDYFNDAVRGLGFMFGALTVVVVARVTEIGGTTWFMSTLNESRLDKYYWLLAVFSTLNLLIFVFVNSFYRYDYWKPSQKDDNN